MIEVKNLVRSYGDRTAVDGISFTVQKGEILGFLGQNGAGKTTTMKIITGFMPSTSGTVKVAGFDVFDEPMEVKRRIGYLPENPPVYPELLVSEYLSFIADLRAVPSKGAAIDRVLTMLRLGDVRTRLIGNLSKGYRQRVGLAGAMIHDPEILILDEPMVGLDPMQLHEIRELIRSMRGQKTIVYSTHILSEVSVTCDRIVIINRGKIVAQDSIGNLDGGKKLKLELSVQNVNDALLASLKNISGVTSVEGSPNSRNILIESQPDDTVVVEVARVAAKNGLMRLNPMAHSLEEYYLSLVTGARSHTI